MDKNTHYDENTDNFFRWEDEERKYYEYEELEECGSCGCYHLATFSGDCRDDYNRF